VVTLVDILEIEIAHNYLNPEVHIWKDCCVRTLVRQTYLN